MEIKSAPCQLVDITPSVRAFFLKEKRPSLRSLCLLASTSGPFWGPEVDKYGSGGILGEGVNPLPSLFLLEPPLVGGNIPTEYCPLLARSVVGRIGPFRGPILPPPSPSPFARTHARGKQSIQILPSNTRTHARARHKGPDFPPSLIAAPKVGLKGHFNWKNGH